MLSYLQYFEVIKYKLDDKNLYEMANLQPKNTGLKSTIHVMMAGSHIKHGPRVKVSNIAGTYHPDDNFTVTAEHEPRVIGNCKLSNDHLADVIDWVKRNHAHIHKVWHKGGEMDPDEVSTGFVKL